MDRQPSRSSHRSQHSPSSSNPNIFSDEYTLQAIESNERRQRQLMSENEHGAAQGGSVVEDFLTSSMGDRSQEVDIESVMREGHPYQTTRRNSYPSSLSRSQSMGSASDAPSPSTPRRSTRTSFGFPRAQSPYQGATGPSHPYGMYSQGANVTRTPSVATTSSIRQPERAYVGPRGPSQPYSMYPQNTVLEDDRDPFNDPSHVIEHAYPAGSRLAPQAHQRRLGPDGEDVDDLIGPDGYAEQLPPYTQFANDIPPKRDLDASNQVNYPTPASDQSPTATPVAYPSEASQSISQHGQNPIYVSHTIVQTTSQSALEGSSTQVSSTTAVDAVTKDERGGTMQRVQRRGKRKVCWGRVPCWLFLAVILFCIAIVIGGIIGALLAHHHGVEKGVQAALTSAQPSTPATTITSITPAETPDDALLPSSTPVNMPAIPTGSFAATLNDPSVLNSGCLSEPAQNNSWDCSTGASLNVVVNTTPPGQGSSPYITLTYPALPNSQIRYGAQPPQLSGPTKLILGQDRKDPNMGLAYTFAQKFNKTVIVRAEDFPGAIPLSRRDKDWSVKRWLGDVGGKEVEMLPKREEQQSDWNQTDYAGPKDRPWLCFWNNTILDGFIYVAEHVDQLSGSQSSTAQAAVPSRVSKRQTPLNLPEYPRAIKIEERRKTYNTIQPYCQQMQVLQNGQLGKVTKEDGVTLNIVNITASEGETYGTQVYDNNSPGDSGGGSGQHNQYQSRKRGNRQLSGCQCTWKNT